MAEFYFETKPLCPGSEIIEASIIHRTGDKYIGLNGEGKTHRAALENLGERVEGLARMIQEEAYRRND